MLEKGLIIIVFMYCMSFSFIGVQYMMADAVGITLKSVSGTPIQSEIVTRANIGSLDQLAQDAAETDEGLISTNPVLAAAALTWELFQIMTGTYIFTILLIFDIPPPFVTGIIIIYTILMIRAIIGYLRGFG